MTFPLEISLITGAVLFCLAGSALTVLESRAGHRITFVLIQRAFERETRKSRKSSLIMDLLDDILSSMDKNKRPALSQPDKAIQSE